MSGIPSTQPNDRYQDGRKAAAPLEIAGRLSGRVGLKRTYAVRLSVEERTRFAGRVRVLMSE